MTQSNIRFSAVFVILVLVLTFPYACLAQDHRSAAMRRAIRATLVPTDSGHSVDSLTKQIEMIDLDLKILEQNRQRQVLSKKQQEQAQAQQAQFAELDQKIAELRGQREDLQYEQSVQQLKNQMQLMELDHKIRELNEKRQTLQVEHQRERNKTDSHIRLLDEQINEQNYERQAIQLKQRREELMNGLNQLKKGQKESQEPKESQ